MDVEDFDTANAKITEVTGKVIFAGYSLASVLVALNLLIAMLNNSYKKVDVSGTTQPRPPISRSHFTSETRGFWLDIYLPDLNAILYNHTDLPFKFK